MRDSVLLADAITKVKEGLEYIRSKKDDKILVEMLSEVNRLLGTDIHFLAQIDMCNIPHAGMIYKKYIWKFDSESIRAFLVPQIVADRVENCDMLLLDLYKKFKLSNEYIPDAGRAASAHIYVRYDNAFRQRKPKHLAAELIDLVMNPRDAVYLPFTVQMISAWKLPCVRTTLLEFLHPESITAQDVGMTEDAECYYPPLSFIKRELLFCALQGLKNYPTEEIRSAIEPLASSQDRDIAFVARKTLKALCR